MDTPVSSSVGRACWHALSFEETERRLETSVERGLDVREAQSRDG
jgi:hypothetical protein